MLLFIIAMTLLSILGGLLTQTVNPMLSSYLRYAILLMWTFNIFLILFTKYCEMHEDLFSQLPNLSMWKILPSIRLYLKLRPHLRIVTVITLIAYPAIYLILYALDSKFIFVFSIGMFLSMVISAIAWGWVLSWFVMGWPTPILDEELDSLNKEMDKNRQLQK